MLDVCPGALCLCDAAGRIVHVNQRLAALFPVLVSGTDWSAALTVFGTARHEPLADGHRFTAGEGDRLVGIRVSAFREEDQDHYLVCATPIAAQQQLQQGLDHLFDDATRRWNGAARRRVAEPHAGVAAWADQRDHRGGGRAGRL